MFIVYISYGCNSLPSFQYKIQDHEGKRERERRRGREWSGRQTDRQRGERRRVVNEGRERGREQVNIKRYIFNEPGTCPSALIFR